MNTKCGVYRKITSYGSISDCDKQARYARAHTLESYLFHFFARYVFIPAQKERYSDKVGRLQFHSGLRGQTSSLSTAAKRSEGREMIG